MYQEGLCLLRSTGRNRAAKTSQLITCASGGCQPQPHIHNAEGGEHCFAPHQGPTPARDGAVGFSHPGQNPGRAHGWCLRYTANSASLRALLCLKLCEASSSQTLGSNKLLNIILHTYCIIYILNMYIQGTTPPSGTKADFTYTYVCI